MKTKAEGSGLSTRKFSEIRRPETPERRAAIDAIKDGMAVAAHLFEIRKGRGITQVELAERMGVSQGNVSELERRDDLFLSTLRGYVHALGGRLELSVRFEDGEVVALSAGPDPWAKPLDDVLPSRSDSGAAIG